MSRLLHVVILVAIAIVTVNAAVMGPCDRARTVLEAHSKHMMEASNGIPPLGAELPRCLPDGTFAPVQCRGSQCFCVSASGGWIANYRVDRWKSDEMHCGCARDEFEFQQASLLGKTFFCASNGNYDVIQCRGTVCHCTDSFGVRLPGSGESLIWETTKLNCNHALLIPPKPESRSNSDKETLS